MTAAELRAQADQLEAEEKSRQINCEQLLDEVSSFMRRFVLLTDDQASILALWTIHTYCWQAADQTPYISVVSPEPRCGKSRLVEVLETLVANPLVASRLTAAALPRAIHKFHPTLFLDEADVTFANKDNSDPIRQVLNSGHRAGNPSLICVPSKKKGGDWDIQQLDTYCPKLICSIDKLPGTLEDRSIVITVTRKLESDGIERFYNRDNVKITKDLSEKMAKWSVANTLKLKAMRPQLPSELSDRRQEAVEQLVAIADLAGGKWPIHARSALVELCCERFEGTSESIQLLADIQEIFTDLQKTFISTVELLQRLKSMESGQWIESNLTKLGIASMLKKHYIFPVQSRLKNGHAQSKPVRGYRLDSFAEPWKRFVAAYKYLSYPLEAVQSVQANNDAVKSVISESVLYRVGIGTEVAKDLSCHYEVPAKQHKSMYARFKV